MEPASFILVIIAVATILLTIAFRFLNKSDVKITNFPKVNSFFPFGSWYGLWSKVIGEVDLKNLKADGQLFWTFDGTHPNLFVADLNVIKSILTEKADCFSSYRAQRVDNPILQNSLENIETNNIRLNSIFNQENVKKLLPRIQRSAEALVHSLQNKDLSSSMYIQPHVMQYVGDVIAMTIFGIDLYSDEFKDQRAVFMEHVNKVFKVQNPTSFCSVIPYTRKSKALENNILPKDSSQYFIDLCHSVIENKRQISSEVTKVEGKALDVIDILLEVFYDKNEHKEDGRGDYVEDVSKTEGMKETVTTQCLSLVLYAVRSTEAGLSQSAYILANKQEEQVKLYEEIINVDHSSNDTTYEKLCFDAKNIDVFLKEIHRLYPIEYRFVRDLKKEIRIGEVTIGPEMSVTIPIYAIHHSEEFFSEPALFKPERFTGNDNVLTVSPEKYLPHGEASSNPTFVGILLVKLFIKMGIIHLTKSFKLSPPSPEFQAPLDFAKGITEVPVTMPVFVKLEKRA